MAAREEVIAALIDAAYAITGGTDWGEWHEPMVKVPVNRLAALQAAARKAES